MVWTIKPHHLQKNVPLYAQTILNVAQQNIQPPQKYANFIKNVFQAILNLKTIYFTGKVSIIGANAEHILLQTVQRYICKLQGKNSYLLLLLLFTESCFQNGQYTGNEFPLLEKIPSAYACQKICQEFQYCKFWTFDNYNNHGYCHRYDFIDTSLDFKTCEPTFMCISGPKSCQPQGR